MPQKKRYKWYPNVARYRAKNGRFMSEKTVSGHIDELTKKFSASVHKSATKLLADFSEEKFAKWSVETRRQLMTMHNAVTVIALGGKKASLAFATENNVAWGNAERALGEQLRYFDRFMLATISGAVSDGQFPVRAAMYPLAGFGTYQNAVRIRNMVQSGYTEERRVLNSGQPCVDCINEDGKGWQPIGTLRHIGDSVCISRCRCYFQYRKRA